MAEAYWVFGTEAFSMFHHHVHFRETGQKVRIMKEGEKAREGDLYTHDRAGKHVPV
jgi:hypothetical protein